MKIIKFIGLINLLILLVLAIFSYSNLDKDNNQQIKVIKKTVIDSITTKDELIISAVGDCTIGTDPSYGYSQSFTSVFDSVNKDYGYFFRGVGDVVYKDDLTIANLETTFTDATKEAVKKFNFKGPKEYANILTHGSVEVVNTANNHTYDYLEQGYQDTINTLDEFKVGYFGESNYLIKEVKGIKIGLIGYYVLENPNIYEDVKTGLDYLKSQNVDLIYVTYHWGIERSYKQNNDQTNLAHWTIDNGADLIIGHHPHVIQGVEKYKDKYIIYSLANFVFGGNRNPDDKDAFIFQIKYNLLNNEIVDNQVKLIPVSVSGKDNVNDFQPQILDGERKQKVIKKIMKSSVNIQEEEVFNEN